ncbi:unnamed protein product [Rotaria magnacalcarata]|uniref:Uncharacterized protein n=1 Tax=Rotaria magnacalcarata TaxID=392030 RepID=A0A816R459_9BILA|nr:unnamed protein product [Rotaria magnacalcarata]CAF1412700.1 unnamed protein product [Rotaria magnacalcarata]CAF2069973.1 unnamed protein product [Rotaria magnacalcarata]CAF3850100.1 unnamed protein product [Rotaria magnacalcarata]CAF3951021.1 unnamed protein product [Rotaria magnacalcarata]
MSQSHCSPLAVHRIFQSLLSEPTRSNSFQKLAESPRTPHSHLTSPPAKHTIRYIENDQNNRREKYDGRRWRLACTWDVYACTNLAGSRQLCSKHNAIRLNKVLPKNKKRKSLSTNLSLPIISHSNGKNNNYNDGNDDDDDIQILEEFCKNSTTRHCMNSTVKSELTDFNVFSVENLDNTDFQVGVKSEPRFSTSYCTTSKDVEYVSSTTRANGLNIGELVSKHIPPLTDFEEEYVAARLMERIPRTCPMLDGQLFVHNEAILVVHKNYRIKMDSIAPEYFYDFLLRHPRVALHYKNWFLLCKMSPPTTGCLIDTKVWTLSMIVRGSMTSDDMIDECDG